MIVYTAICGSKDKPRDDIRVFSTYDKFVSPVMNAKIYKVLPHKFLDDDVTMWVDGNIFLLEPVEKIVEDFLGGADMAVWKHPERDCIFKEAEAAKGLFENIDIRNSIDEHINHYASMCIPSITLAECNVIIRRNTPTVNAFNEAWWAEICRWSFRDQLSFPVVLRNFPINVNYIVGNVRNHKYFKYEPHFH